MATSPAEDGRRLSNGLHLIDLDQPLPGQRRFISCWASLAPDLNYIVDPGPPSTAAHLIDRLTRLGVERLDLVLLTHVHLDHGGCTAQILARWPQAKVFCHEVGRPHLVDPARLWSGSQQVLGEKARVYGEPQPVPAAALAGPEVLKAHGVEAIETPGHASHHLAYRHGERLFLGECAGTFSDLGRGPGATEYYLRPATPPRFQLETAESSLDRLLALDPVPAHLLFAHHGDYRGDGRALLQSARRQLRRWTETVREVRSGLAGLPHTEQPTDEAALLDLLAAALRQVDPHFARGVGLPEDIRLREQDFTRQTLRGILGYLRDA